MNINQQLIQSLNSNQQAAFSKYLAGRNKRKEGKNIRLYKALSAGKEKELKAEIGSNHYHVLNNRLTDRLIDYSASQLFQTEVTTEINIIKQLLVARNLLKKSAYKSGFNLLLKARSQAKEHLLYNLLSEIYHSLIEYSHHPLAPEQAQLFEEYEENRQQLKAEEQLNMAYAIIRKAFYEAEHQAKPINLKELFDQTFDNLGIDDQLAYSFKSVYQLAQLADIKGAVSKDYYSIDLFFVDKLKEIQNGADDTPSSLKYHIALLYLIANIYFRKKDFDSSFVYLQQMQEQMLKDDARYYRQNEWKYSNLMALNLHLSNQSERALEILNQLKENAETSKRDLHQAYLIRIMIYFHQEEWSKALKLFAQLQHSDKWYKRELGLEWLLNKKYIEILLHIELDNIDYVDSRIQSLMRTHGAYLKQSMEFQVLPFLRLVKTYCKDPLLVREAAFHQEVEDSIQWKPHYQEDLFLMCFYAWLKAKMLNEPLYDVTLALIEQSKKAIKNKLIV